MWGLLSIATPMLCNTATFSKRRKKKVQQENATPFSSIARCQALLLEA
jgi:hypothetical protein